MLAFAAYVRQATAPRLAEAWPVGCQSGGAASRPNQVLEVVMDLKKPEQYVFDEGKRIPQEHWDEILPTLTPPERIKKHCLLEKDNCSYHTRQRRGRLNE